MFTSKSQSTIASKAPDAITLLKQDHSTVKKLLAELAETTMRAVARRRLLLAKVAREIRTHATIEEEIFYPAFLDAREKEADGQLYYEAQEEHHVVDLVLPELEDTAPSSESFGGKAKVLKDLIEHHAEEEEREMFPRARKLLGKERIAELGQAMHERKLELQQAAEPRRRAKRRA